MLMHSFYQVEPIDGRITAIRSMTGEILYLLHGDERDLLVDTCLGVGNLRELVDSLSTHPLTVVLTHGHIDHAMGAPEFNDVYMSHLDTEIYLSMRDPEGRLGYIRANLGGQLPEGIEETLVAPAPMTFHDLHDGDVFDLGGIHAEIYALPGHTPGSMVVLIPEERVLILGDACNKSTFLFDENSLTVEEYRAGLVLLRDRLAGRYERVFICHHDMEMQPDIMDHVIDVCDDIMAGRVDDVPFVFMGTTNYIAKAVGERMNRLDGIDGNIIYSKDKIRKGNSNGISGN